MEGRGITAGRHSDPADSMSTGPDPDRFRARLQCGDDGV
jgi:hypothetical protein